MEKVTILFLYSAKGFGGLGRNLSIITGNLDKTKFRILVGLIAGPEDKEADFRNTCSGLDFEGIEFVRLGDGRAFQLKLFREIVQIAKENKVDIISCHGYKAKIYVGLLKLSRQVKQKLVFIAHGWVTPGFKNAIYHFLDKSLSCVFDKAILVSEAQRKELRWFFVPKQRIEVINNAIDVESFANYKVSSNLRDELSLDENVTLMGFLGRLSPEKDIATSIKALARLNATEGKYFLVVAGEGPQRDFLNKLAVRLGVENQLCFLGFLPDVRSVYQAIDIYLSSSIREGLPNSLLEAQASGVPCVASNIGGHWDLIDDGVNGVLFEVGNVEQLSEKIRQLFQDQSYRDEIRRAAKENLAEKFSVEVRIQKLEKMYLSVVE